MSDVRGKLTALWSAVLFNMIYADILGFLNADFLQSGLSAVRTVWGVPP